VIVILHLKVFGVGEGLHDIKSIPRKQDTRQEERITKLGSRGVLIMFI
jgi:hypothetical protein